MQVYDDLACTCVTSFPLHACRYRREDLEIIDNQGRCVISDHGAFVLFNCYGPAVTNITSDRFAFKMQYYEVIDIPLYFSTLAINLMLASSMEIATNLHHT